MSIMDLIYKYKFQSINLENDKKMYFIHEDSLLDLEKELLEEDKEPCVTEPNDVDYNKICTGEQCVLYNEPTPDSICDSCGLETKENPPTKKTAFKPKPEKQVKGGYVGGDYIKPGIIFPECFDDNPKSKYTPEFEELWNQDCDYLGGAQFVGSKQNTFLAYKKVVRKSIKEVPEWLLQRHGQISDNPKKTVDIIYFSRKYQLPAYKRRIESGGQLKSLQYWLSDTGRGRGWTYPPESIFSGNLNKKAQPKERYVCKKR